MLARDGRIDLLDPVAGTVSAWLALRSLPTDTSGIHELVSGTVTLIPTVLPTVGVLVQRGVRRCLRWSVSRATWGAPSASPWAPCSMIRATRR